MLDETFWFLAEVMFRCSHAASFGSELTVLAFSRLTRENFSIFSFVLKCGTGAIIMGRIGVASDVYIRARWLELKAMTENYIFYQPGIRNQAIDPQCYNTKSRLLTRHAGNQ